MDNLIDWGIDFILALRQFAPGLIEPFEFFTFLGNEMAYLLLIPFVYWCFDRQIGVRLTILFLLSAYLNSAVKRLAGQPRPFDVALERLLPLFEYPAAEAKERYGAFGYGFPSGHTQNSLVIWAYLASWIKRAWFWIVAVLLVILIPLSRIYLAVHFPHDVVGGYVFGAVLLLLYIWLEPKVSDSLSSSSLAWQLGIALAIPVLTMILVRDETSITAGATWIGMGTGFVLERRWIGFASGGAWWKQLLRYLLGVVVLLVLYTGLKALFSRLEPALLFRFFRYGLIGLWGGLGAPWMFVTLKLAQKRVNA
jgi:membrane-associated phospholipid phosphatase